MKNHKIDFRIFRVFLLQRDFLFLCVFFIRFLWTSQEMSFFLFLLRDYWFTVFLDKWMCALEEGVYMWDNLISIHYFASFLFWRIDLQTDWGGFFRNQYLFDLESFVWCFLKRKSFEILMKNFIYGKIEFFTLFWSWDFAQIYAKPIYLRNIFRLGNFKKFTKIILHFKLLCIYKRLQKINQNQIGFFVWKTHSRNRAK